MSQVVVIAFYKFVRLSELPQLKIDLLALCKGDGLLGTILIAEEGINGMLGGTREQIDSALRALHADPRFSDLDWKESFTDVMPFEKMKVRLKREIVALGVPQVDPTHHVGTYVAPQEWNTLISEPDVIVIDTRNSFEVDYGTFKNAIDPKTKAFRDFPDFVKENLESKKDQKIAMFCTGGIRCEKATSYLLDQGFHNVYHLQGGILKYLEEIPKEESLFEGECFVFDERVSLDHELKQIKNS